jgi:hypothetical protein
VRKGGEEMVSCHWMKLRKGKLLEIERGSTGLEEGMDLSEAYYVMNE